MWLDRIERLHNRASDTAFVWFPFTLLRPAPTQIMNMPRLVLMSLVFGIYYGASYALTGALFRGQQLFDAIPHNVLGATLIFFLWFNLVTAPLWNRRARRNS